LRTRLALVALLSVTSIVLGGCAPSTTSTQRAQVATDFVNASLAGDTDAAVSMGDIDRQAFLSTSSELRRWIGARTPQVHAEREQAGHPSGFSVPAVIDTGESSATVYVLVGRNGRVVDWSVSGSP
jgi:hypothetical protein